MPKGKRKSQGVDRPPSLRGAIVVDEIYGKPRIRAWPKPRPAPRHPTNVRWTNWLQGVTYLWKYQPANFQAQLMQATKGTPWMARDPFISAFRGRAWSFTDQFGWTYYPKVVQEQVSQSLDALSQTPGTMLYRGSALWLPIAPPTDPLQVLTSQALGTAPEWVTPPEGPGGAPGFYPDAPPETAGPIDDEFLGIGSGVPSGWNLVDPGADTAVAVDEAGLKLSTTGSATNGWGGVYKAIQSAPFTVWVKVSVLGEVNSRTLAGICMWQDATDANSDLCSIGIDYNGASPAIRIDRWTAWNSGDTDIYSPVSPSIGPSTWYFRLRLTGTTYRVDISTDGLGWMQVPSFTLPFTPLHIGLGFRSTNVGAAVSSRFAFFRSLASDVGQGGLVYGRRY